MAIDTDMEGVTSDTKRLGFDLSAEAAYMLSTTRLPRRVKMRLK